MQIIYNNEKLDIASDSTLLDFLKSQNLSDQKGVALAVNDEVVPRSRWSNFNLNENDQLLVVQATQGG